jgi:hypothetical protein
MNKGVIGFVATAVLGVGIMLAVMWSMHSQFSGPPADTAKEFREVALDIGDVRGPGVFEGVVD